MSEVRAIGDRTNNAQLMADCDTLGYLGDTVLDLTYGLGRFWNHVTPLTLTTNDLNPETSAAFNEDFTKTRWLDNSFDTVVLDAPYKLNGTGGSHPSDKGYGVAGDYASVEDKMLLIWQGSTEALRLARHFVLIKCQDQVVSGKVYWQTQSVIAHMANRGIFKPNRLVDMLHVQGYRPQPPGRRQVHARRDYSTLLVFGVDR